MKEKLKGYVKSFNFLAIGNFFAKPKKEESPAIEFELFELAVDNFLKSGDRELTNSYETVKVLLGDFLDPKREKIYQQLTTAQQLFIQAVSDTLENIVFRDFAKLSEKQAKICDDLAFKCDDFKSKKNLRNVFNKIDDIIEKELIWPIKYNENLSFDKKLLLKRGKKKTEDIAFELNEALPKIVDKLEREFKNDPKLRDVEGNFIVDQDQLNLAIYERIYLKANKQLGISQEFINAIFKGMNTSYIDDNINESMTREMYMRCLTKLIPPHLVDLSPMLRIDKKSLQQNPDLHDAYILVLEAQIDKYKYDPSKRQLVEESMQALLMCCDMHFSVAESLPASVSAEKYNGYISQLEEFSKAANQELIDNPKNKLAKKGELSNYEKKAISILSKISNSPNTYVLSESNAKFLSDFVSYAEGNKEFNKRLGKVLKSKDDFVKFNMAAIDDIYKFTFKTVDNQKLAEKIEKINKFLLIEDAVFGQLQYDDIELNKSYKIAIRDFIKSQSASLSDENKKVLEKLSVIETVKLSNDEIELLKNLHKNLDSDEQANIIEKLIHDPNAALTTKEENMLYSIIDNYESISDKEVDIIGKLLSVTITVLTDQEKLELQKVQENYKLTEEEKIALKEIGKISKFASISNSKLFFALEECLKNFELKNITDLLKRIKDAANFIVDLQGKVESSTQLDIKSGDIVMDVGSKANKVYGTSVRGIRERLKRWITTPYSHAAIGLDNKRAGPVFSHVDTGYELNPMSKYAFAMHQETFRILPHMLLSPKNKQLLLNALGFKGLNANKELKDFLQSEYQKIALKLHTEIVKNEQHNYVSVDQRNVYQGNLFNSYNKQNQAGIADFIPFGHKTTESNRKWAEKALDNKEPLSEQLSPKDKKGNPKGIICSEFAAKMTVLSLVELEKQLVAKIQKKDPAFKIKTGALIKIPFGEFEDLSKVHPTRLIKILQKAHAIEKVEKKKFGQNFIRGA